MKRRGGKGHVLPGAHGVNECARSGVTVFLTTLGCSGATCLTRSPCNTSPHKSPRKKRQRLTEPRFIPPVMLRTRPVKTVPIAATLKVLNHCVLHFFNPLLFFLGLEKQTLER